MSDTSTAKPRPLQVLVYSDDVNTRQQAVVKAIGLGLITPEDHHR